MQQNCEKRRNPLKRRKIRQKSDRNRQLLTSQWQKGYYLVIKGQKFNK